MSLHPCKQTTTFTCDRCKETKTHTSKTTTGYGTAPDGKKHCFECCALDAKEYMREHGKITLYLTKGPDKTPYVSNWSETLKYPISGGYQGKHNIAHVRYDVWFYDEHGNKWHGVQYGDNTQLCHCKRMKG